LDIILATAQQSEAAQLSMYVSGAILLKPDGQIVTANAAAQQILRSHPALFEQNGQLVIRRVLEAKIFAEALAAVVSNRPPILVALRNRQGAPIIAISLSCVPNGPNIMAVIADLYAKLTITIEGLRSLFGFTQAEARIAEGLANGATATSLAADLGISITTIRAHLRALLPKAGATSQTRLIAVLLRAEHTRPDLQNLLHATPSTRNA
jgi:DNA-binding CsgD family transcriptional regulator